MREIGSVGASRFTRASVLAGSTGRPPWCRRGSGTGDVLASRPGNIRPISGIIEIRSPGFSRLIDGVNGVDPWSRSYLSDLGRSV